MNVNQIKSTSCVAYVMSFLCVLTIFLLYNEQILEEKSRRDECEYILEEEEEIRITMIRLYTLLSPPAARHFQVDIFAYFPRRAEQSVIFSPWYSILICPNFGKII